MEALILDRTLKLRINAVTSLLNRVVILVSGLILPRLILNNYGSSANGLVSSINQFLSIITFLDLGVGAVVQSALYKPLAERKFNEIDGVLLAAEKYFRKISYVLIIYIVALMILFPSIVEGNSVNYLDTVFLIFALSINKFSQYYFGIVNELLLNADQKSYIQLLSEIVVVLFNLLTSIVLIGSGFSLPFVKLISGLVFLLRPIYLNYYVNRNYDLNIDTDIEEHSLPQKWNGVGQHIAYSVQNSTDIVLLTIFSTLENISIYSVYNMVVNAISLIIQSFTTGLTSFFGNLLANNEVKLLNSYFNKYEWGLHTIIVYLFGLTSTLIGPFAAVYTTGVNDVNYAVPYFAFFLVLGKMIYSLRTPYHSMILAAGHYKQTQISSYIEAGLNIMISFVLVHKYGLVGVTIGSTVALTYRLFYLINYLSKNIVHRKIKIFVKQLGTDIISYFLILLAGNFVVNQFDIKNFLVWIIVAIIVGLMSLIIILIINLLFYRKMFVNVRSLIFKNKYK